jgi:hypothetical protein
MFLRSASIICSVRIWLVSSESNLSKKELNFIGKEKNGAAPCGDDQRGEDPVCQAQAQTTSAQPRDEDDGRADHLHSQQQQASCRRLEAESDNRPQSSIDKPGQASDHGRRRPGQAQQASDSMPRWMITGRLGEAAVHQYLVELLGQGKVRWVNRHRESELPYDIVVTKGGATEYVEVKATVFPEKNWFENRDQCSRVGVHGGERGLVYHRSCGLAG